MRRDVLFPGLLSIGTVFTLFVVPVMYLLIGRNHQQAAAAQARLEASPAH